jgi:hypothetical protein
MNGECHIGLRVLESTLLDHHLSAAVFADGWTFFGTLE